jgi:hypothetical protein
MWYVIPLSLSAYLDVEFEYTLKPCKFLEGEFVGLSNIARCTNFYEPCECNPTANTCGPPQSCSAGGCAGTFDPNSNIARCRGNFEGCICTPSTSACGTARSCDANGCSGTYDTNSNTARCRGNFPGCVCNPTSNTCPPRSQGCQDNECLGSYNQDGSSTCKNAFRGCLCVMPTLGTLYWGEICDGRFMVRARRRLASVRVSLTVSQDGTCTDLASFPHRCGM